MPALLKEGGSMLKFHSNDGKCKEAELFYPFKQINLTGVEYYLKMYWSS